MDARDKSLLQVKDLTVRFGNAVVVNNLSFNLKAGESVALIGESGSGKSMTCLAILGLLPPGAIATGQILYDGINLISKSEQVRKLRKNGKLALIPQNPSSSLNPLLRVGEHLEETIRILKPKATTQQIAEECERVLHEVKLGEHKNILKAYPVELSGGMCQRVMIAMALLREPELLLADEPTTALDVIVQAEVMKLLLTLVHSRKLSMILVTHDLAVVAQSCPSALVLKNGTKVESGSIEDLYNRPQASYTKELLAAAREIL